MLTEDLVLSDVHLGSSECQSVTNLDENEKNYKIVRTRFEFFIPKVDSEQESEPIVKDSDDDFVIPGRSIEKDVMIIDHVMATKLSDVGLQVWNGAILMCDFILTNKELFCEKTILELGCGVGMVSVCLSIVGSHVYATDLDQSILRLCERNLFQNKPLMKNRGTSTVKKFDWNVGFDNTLWTENEIKTVGNCDIIVAADVIYDIELNEILFKQIIEMCKDSDKTVYLALEKRLNFTLAHLDVVCPQYEHFLEFLKDRKNHFWSVKQIDVDHLPECFGIERNLQMELWELRSKTQIETI